MHRRRWIFHRSHGVGCLTAPVFQSKQQMRSSVLLLLDSAKRTARAVVALVGAKWHINVRSR